MTSEGLRKVGLAAALLLFAVLMGGGPRVQQHAASQLDQAGAPLPLHPVTLTVKLPESAPAPVSVSVVVYRIVGATFPEAAREIGKGLEFSLNLAAGNYLFVVRAPGYARAVLRHELSGKAALRVELTEAHRMTIEVVASVADELVPVVGATVLVDGDGGLPHGLLTSKDGKALFDALGPGRHRVVVYAPGYEPYEATAEGDLLVRLRPVRTLRVRVTDGGRPVSGATVAITGVTLWPPRQVSTGPKGYIDITGLREGSYFLSAHHRERASKALEAKVESQVGITEIALELGVGLYATARIVEEPPAEEASDLARRAIAGARVTYSSGGLGQFVRHGESDDKGWVRLGPLAEVEGTFQVRAPGFVPRVIEATNETVEIPLTRAGTVTGRVVDEHGRPVSGATVEVVGTDRFGMPVSVYYRSESIADAHFDWALATENVLVPAGELGVLLGPVPPIPLGDVQAPSGGMLTTDESGRFLVPDVPPGQLVVLARHPDYMDGKSSVLTLIPGGRAETEVVLGSGVPLRGRVVDDRGFPLAHARLKVSGPGFERQLLTESDGTFELMAAPFIVRLRVARADRPMQVLLEMDVPAEQRKQEVAVVMPPPRENVVVHCQDEKGAPVPLAQVVLASTDPRVPLRMTRFTDDQGRVEFDEARGLSAQLSVEAPGLVEGVFERKLAAVEKVVLKLALRLEGRVTAVRGRQPAAGAKVTLTAPGVTRVAIANAVGEYVFTQVPPGSASIQAEHPELGRGSLAILVKGGVSGRPATAPPLDLRAAKRVRGRIVDAAGRPAPLAYLSLTRLGPYLPALSDSGVIGQAEADGTFDVEVEEPEGELYLYGARAGHAFGFSDAIAFGSQDVVEGVKVVLDRTDEIAPDERGTILIALEEGRRGLEIFYVAPRSKAARAGLQRGDRIIEIEGLPASQSQEARKLLSGTIGSDVSILVSGASGKKEIRVVREAFRR